MAWYLKALGVLRVVGEQADPGAVARWDAHGFVLQTSLDEEGLERFFLDRYRPTPVVSPWNGSSGFGPEGAGELQVIEESTDDRLAGYRQAVATARDVLSRGLSKDDVVRACRSELPDECLAWVDAAVVLTPDGARFPPLLGTGGNVGRLEISRNFHQRLIQALSLSAAPDHRPEAVSRAHAWLRDALWDLGQSAGVKGSPGQFDPGAAGGTNSAPDGKARPVVNPWDFVLMVEGAMLFAAGTARRLDAGAMGRTASAAPFCVDVAPVGYAGAADEPVKGEVWLPLWERFVTLAEVRRLMAEGRVDWHGRHARTGLDFAKATATLGVDRGIAAFGRYVLAERFGQATVALAAGRVRVGARDGRDGQVGRLVAPLAELDGWLDRLRRAEKPPAGVRHGLRRVDAAAYEVTRGAPGALSRVLVEVAALEDAVGRATAFREKHVLGPVRGLTARRWVPALAEDLRPADEDGGCELRLALSLASAHDRAAGGWTVSTSLRTLLRPVEFQPNGRPAWAGSPPVEGLGNRPVIGVLAAAHARRVVDLMAVTRQSRGHEREHDEIRGLPTRFSYYGRAARLADVAALVNGDMDERLLGDLLAGCLLLDWRAPADRSPLPAARPPASLDGTPVPPALTVLGPFFTHQPLAPSWLAGGVGPGGAAEGARSTTGAPSVLLRPEPEWVALLGAGRVRPVLRSALHRLRIAGLDPVLGERDVAGGTEDRRSGQRLAAALLCPLRANAGERLLRRSCPPYPDDTKAHAAAEQTEIDDEETEEVDDAQP